MSPSLPPDPLSRDRPRSSQKRVWARWPVYAAAGSVLIAVAITFLLPGGWRHARTAFGAKEDIPEVPVPPHEVRGLIELSNPQRGEDADKFEHYCNQQALMVKSPSLLQTALADPAVAGLGTFKTASDSMKLLVDNLRVEVSPQGSLAVRMSGDRSNDLKVIVDTLMRLYVEESAAREKHERQERIARVERMAQEVTSNIERMEKEIRTIAAQPSIQNPNGLTAQLLDVQKKLDECRDVSSKREADLVQLERQLGVVRLTEDSIAELMAKQVPAAVLAKLKPCLNKEFSTWRAFAHELSRVLSAEEDQRFNSIIFNAAQLPTVQLPNISPDVVARELNQSFAELKKERDEAEQAYERAKKLAADPKNQTVTALSEKLRQTTLELETKLMVFRKQCIVRNQAAEIMQWRLKILDLGKRVGIEREMVNSYQINLDSLKKELRLSLELQAGRDELQKAVDVQRQSLTRVRGELVRLRHEAQLAVGPRILESAQEVE